MPSRTAGPTRRNVIGMAAGTALFADQAAGGHLRVPGYFEPTPQYDKYILDEYRIGGPYPHLDENGNLVNTL